MKAISLPYKTSRAFTLIELLVVIAIIAILATLGISVGSSVMRNAKKLQAKTAMKGVEVGIGGYRTEYNRLPLAANKDTDDNYTTTNADGLSIIQMLMASDEGDAITNNPRRIKFYEPSNAKNNKNGYVDGTGLVDPWGEAYEMRLDYSGDGILEDPYGGSDLNGSVLLWSHGDPKLGNTETDDVKSWE